MVDVKTLILRDTGATATHRVIPVHLNGWFTSVCSRVYASWPRALKMTASIEVVVLASFLTTVLDREEFGSNSRYCKIFSQSPTSRISSVIVAWYCGAEPRRPFVARANTAREMSTEGKLDPNRVQDLLCSADDAIVWFGLKTRWRNLVFATPASLQLGGFYSTHSSLFA